MKAIRNRVQFVVVIAVITALIVFASIGNYNALVLEFTDAGAAAYQNFDGRASMTACFIETMTTYAGNFLQSGGERKDSRYFSLLKQNVEKNEYNMDMAGGTALENMTGNLTGIGTIPADGIDRQEFNLALSFNDYFSHLNGVMPQIAWIYYTSEQGFVNLYPWIASETVKYAEDMKTEVFYTAVTPQNDPNRKPVWTEVYLDEAGRGPMITLSSPIYYGNEFRGVISIDYTTEVLRRMLKSSFPTYLVNADNDVIAAGEFTVTADKGYHIKDLLALSDDELQALNDAEPGTISAVGANYIYKAEMTDIPVMLVMVRPRLGLFGEALLRTLPIILTGFMLVVIFIVALKLRKTRDKLRDSALTDPLTGLNNRRFLDIVMENEIARADRYKHRMSIICLDLDRFKAVNDTWGHPVGDEVLQLTAAIVKKTIRESDVVVRMGGEEFMILLPQTGIEAAMEAAERVRKALETANHPIAGKFTASFGVVERDEAETYTSMYIRVDEALYLAKNAGRNCVRAFDEKAESSAVTINLEWNTAWNCGEETIDRQHRELIEFLNRLMGISLLEKQKAEELFSQAVGKMVEHFEYEQKMLTEAAYPELEQHLDAHKRLLERVANIRAAFFEGTGRPQMVTTFIVDELIVGHLLEEDVKYFAYIRK